MNFEKPESVSEHEHFQRVLQHIQENPGTYVEYLPGFPKHKLLQFLLENNYLLHGTSIEEVEMLEPRQANDASKKSGNQTAVYAVDDPILPLFYAIKDRKRLRGMVRSGYSIDDKGNKIYRFQIDGTRSEENPWKNGVVLVLPKSSFEQTKDDNGKSTSEWVSYEPVVPVARLRVTPEDFPYLNDVKVVK